MSVREYFHLPAIAAGFVCVLVGFTGSAVIIFQAAQAAGATTGQVGSWMMALGFGMGVTTIGLSLCAIGRPLLPPGRRRGRRCW